MGNTDDKKEDIIKTIPRNPNMPIKNEDVDKLLKEAAQQVSEKEKNAGLKSSKKTEDKKVEQKKETVDTGKKMLDVKMQEKDTKRENINLQKPADKMTEKKKDTDVKSDTNKTKASVTNAKKLDTDKKDSNMVDNTSKNGVSDRKPETSKKNGKETSKNQKDFKVEDDVYVTKKPVNDKASHKSYKMSVGDVIGSVFEGIWTGIKLIVLVTIVTAIVGFFMSRELMIRGRSGEQLSKQGMTVAATTLSTRTEARKAGKTWNETVKKEKLTLEADDGKILVAQKIIVDKNNDNWVVILHGQNGSVEDIYDIGLRYATEGYNILMPDLRAHGESEGSYYGMGWLDRLDVINWIDVILDEHSAANIIIHGVDLGADTALMLSGEPLKDSIKVIVAEGAYTSAWDAVKTEYKTRHADWPTFPMLHMLNPVAKVWGGYSLTEADAVDQVKKTKLPILLIHGSNDTYVTADMTEEINQAIASEHEVLTIATGTHEDCRFAEPDTYYNKVFEFVEKYVD